MLKKEQSNRIQLILSKTSKYKFTSAGVSESPLNVRSSGHNRRVSRIGLSQQKAWIKPSILRDSRNNLESVFSTKMMMYDEATNSHSNEYLNGKRTRL
jgi:hypothetical protein